MPRIVKVNEKQGIKQLFEQGWSQRRISKELGFNRRTVSKYIKADDFKCTIPNTGSGSGKCTNTNTGSEKNNSVHLGRRSSCDSFWETIKEKHLLGLNGQRIYQDLVSDYGYTGSSQAVRRYIRKHKETKELPYRVMHSLPGEEAQVDFGQGAPVLEENGRKKKPHLFRIVLCNSRKAYSEVVATQSSENFLRALENSFRYFGGVPKTLVTDNLKAAVIKADWYDPEINPKLRSFAEHYGVVVLPTKPYTPEHKGKIENGIKYCQDNALKGRVFKSLQEQNIFLRDWEKNIADKRIHGTTQIQVQKAFEENKKSALQPLPVDLFPCFTEKERKVQRHGHVEVNRSFYSVPPEYLGLYVWVRHDLRTVKVYNQKMDQIAIHAILPKGKYSTQHQHISKKKINAGEYGSAWLLKKLSKIGDECAIWGEVMLLNRGIEGIRVMQGLLSLSKKHSDEALRKASLTAIKNECFYLKDFKALLNSQEEQPDLGFTDIHPYIRKMGSYAQFADFIFDDD